MQKREFTIPDECHYNRSGPVRWIISHALRYPLLPLATVVLAMLGTVFQSLNRILVGRAFDLVLAPDATAQLLVGAALPILGAGLGQGITQLARNLVIGVLARRFERYGRHGCCVYQLCKSVADSASCTECPVAGHHPAMAS